MSRGHAPRHAAAVSGSQRGWVLLAVAGTCLVLAGTLGLRGGSDVPPGAAPTVGAVTVGGPAAPPSAPTPR